MKCTTDNLKGVYFNRLYESQPDTEGEVGENYEDRIISDSIGKSRIQYKGFIQLTCPLTYVGKFISSYEGKYLSWESPQLMDYSYFRNWLIPAI